MMMARICEMKLPLSKGPSPAFARRFCQERFAGSAGILPASFSTQPGMRRQDAGAPSAMARPYEFVSARLVPAVHKHAMTSAPANANVAQERTAIRHP